MHFASVAFRERGEGGRKGTLCANASSSRKRIMACALPKSPFFYAGLLQKPFALFVWLFFPETKHVFGLGVCPKAGVSKRKISLDVDMGLLGFPMRRRAEGRGGIVFQRVSVRVVSRNETEKRDHLNIIVIIYFRLLFFVRQLTELVLQFSA